MSYILDSGLHRTCFAERGRNRSRSYDTIRYDSRV